MYPDSEDTRLSLYPCFSPQDFAPSVGFEETSYTVDEGVTLEVCAIVTPPLCIGRNAFVQVLTLDGTATGRQTDNWLLVTLF